MRVFADIREIVGRARMAEITTYLCEIAVKREWIIGGDSRHGNAVHIAEGFNVSSPHEAETQDTYFHLGMVPSFFIRLSPSGFAESTLNIMKLRIALLLTVGSAGALSLLSAQTTWNGTITDSMCDKDHSMMATGNKQPNPKDCTLACVKGGSKFVFVSKGKVYQIANQDLGDLKTYAGSSVKLTGELQPDGNTIKAASLQAAK